MENIQKGEIRDNTEEIKSKILLPYSVTDNQLEIHRKASIREISKEGKIYRESEEEKYLWR